MKKWLSICAILFLGILIGLHFEQNTHAQAAGTPFTITVSGLHTACDPIVAGTTKFCYAQDGLWQSLNGAAYTQLGVGAATGVTSVSVNGALQTGAVVITVPTKATTTLQ